MLTRVGRGGVGGWMHGWMDWLHEEKKNVCYVIKITKQSLAEGLSLPVLPSLVTLPTHINIYRGVSELQTPTLLKH